LPMLLGFPTCPSPTAEYHVIDQASARQRPSDFSRLPKRLSINLNVLIRAYWSCRLPSSGWPVVESTRPEPVT
jgi:hypothetical protein